MSCCRKARGCAAEISDWTRRNSLFRLLRYECGACIRESSVKSDIILMRASHERATFYDVFSSAVGVLCGEIRVCV